MKYTSDYVPWITIKSLNIFLPKFYLQMADSHITRMIVVSDYSYDDYISFRRNIVFIQNINGVIKSY